MNVIWFIGLIFLYIIILLRYNVSVTHNESGKNVVTSAQQYTEKVSSKRKVYGTYSDSMSSSDILRSELYNAGISNPPYKNAAHHIVPWNDPRAVGIRDILDEYEIDYNSAVNGVFLPMEENAYTGDAAKHVGNHSKEYIRLVQKRLQDVVDADGSADDIVSTINLIRKELLEGTIKLN